MICIADLVARARKLRYYASISAKSNICHKEEGEGGEVKCTTRWRLVISDHNSISACLLNDATLVKWYKDDLRRDEIHNC